jgi:hypothetical protein
MVLFNHLPPDCKTDINIIKNSSSQNCRKIMGIVFICEARTVEIFLASPMCNLHLSISFGPTAAR